MHLGESVTVCFGIPVLPADLIALSPGYRVPPDLATIPYAPWHMRFVLMEAAMSDRMFETTLSARDVKCVTASCRNDAMISYKKVPSSWECGSFFGYRPPIEPSAIFVQPCALPEPFQRLSLFP